MNLPNESMQQELMQKLAKQEGLAEQQDVSTPVQTPTVPEGATATTESPLRSKIEEIEQQLGKAPISVTDSTAKARVYLDDYGDETFYVENLSNGHVVVSDLNITIPRGKSVDLLQSAAIDDLKKSRDIRTMLAGATARPMMKRLTPEEYFENIKLELANQRTIEELKARQQQTEGETKTAPEAQAKIRPVILSKLEKLRLFYVPESSHLGLSPIEFVKWALTENLTSGEFEYVLSHPTVIDNSEIRTPLLERKSKI